MIFLSMKWLTAYPLRASKLPNVARRTRFGSGARGVSWSTICRTPFTTTVATRLSLVHERSTGQTLFVANLEISFTIAAGCAAADYLTQNEHAGRSSPSTVRHRIGPPSEAAVIY